jgi:hypothetical protein
VRLGPRRDGARARDLESEDAATAAEALGVRGKHVPTRRRASGPSRASRTCSVLPTRRSSARISSRRGGSSSSCSLTELLLCWPRGPALGRCWLARLHRVPRQWARSKPIRRRLARPELAVIRFRIGDRSGSPDPAEPLDDAWTPCSTGRSRAPDELRDSIRAGGRHPALRGRDGADAANRGQLSARTATTSSWGCPALAVPETLHALVAAVSTR